MSLFLEIAGEKKEDPAGDVTIDKDKIVGPTVPDGWSIGHLAQHGMILSCDGFQLRLDIDQLSHLYDIAEDGEPGEIRDQNGHVVLVEPTDDSIVLTRVNDETYPSGIVLDLETLKEIGIEQGEPEDPDEDQDADVTIDSVTEGVKTAYRRAGGKIKKGFRVTSGFRKGRVVSSVKAASAPRKSAKTRMKLSIAGRKHKFIRLLKSKRTRKKSLSKKLRRMNHT